METDNCFWLTYHDEVNFIAQSNGDRRMTPSSFRWIPYKPCFHHSAIGLDFFLITTHDSFQFTSSLNMHLSSLSYPKCFWSFLHAAKLWGNGKWAGLYRCRLCDSDANNNTAWKHWGETLKVVSFLFKYKWSATEFQPSYYSVWSIKLYRTSWKETVNSSTKFFRAFAKQQTFCCRPQNNYGSSYILKCFDFLFITIIFLLFLTSNLETDLSLIHIIWRVIVILVVVVVTENLQKSS